MLYVNYTNKTCVLYNKSGDKIVVKPGEKIDDLVLPDVVTMDYFIPYGLKRTPKRGAGEVK